MDWFLYEETSAMKSLNAKTCLAPYQTFMMGLFAKIFKGFQVLSSMIDICQDSTHASDL